MSEKEYNFNKELATINLKSITNISSESEGFIINASSWIKDGAAQPHRKFYFTTKSEEIKEWVITIELLKAAAIQQDFKSQFGIDLVNRKDEPRDIMIFNKQIRKTVDDKIKLKAKGMINYMLTHFLGHMIEHAYYNSSKISKTPLILTELGILKSIEKNTIMEQVKPNIIQECEVEDNLFKVDESLIELKEEVKVQVNRSQSSVKESNVVNKSMVISDVKKMVDKYNEGSEAIVSYNFLIHNHMSSSNNIFHTRKNGKKVSIIELQRLKTGSKIQKFDETSISTDILAKEMHRLLLEEIESSIDIKDERVSSPLQKAASTIIKNKKITKDLKPIKNRGNGEGKYGLVTRDVTSIGGDIFHLKCNSVVLVEKINIEDNIATCTYNSLKGLFSLDSIKVSNSFPKP